LADDDKLLPPPSRGDNQILNFVTSPNYKLPTNINMKLFKFVLAFSLATIATASITWSSSNQQVLAPVKVKLPGDSPIYYCYESQKADILQLKYIDLDPNPPPK
jgi:hypothetical protein